MRPNPRWPACLIVAFLTLALVWGSTAGSDEPVFRQPQPGGSPIDLPGLHNVIHISDRLFSGGGPEGKAGFDALKKLGVRTILSVDGAHPDLKRAQEAGLRYVHLPIGYDGISQEQAWKLAKAVRDLPGPIYIHCHHGKHRSPGAAAAIQVCLDPTCTVAQAMDILKRAGTDPRYLGLFAAPRELKRPSAADLDRLPADFPASARIPPLAKLMVQVDRHWEHLTRIRQAGWKAPTDHPDLDPPHEALQLREQYRELARLASTGSRPADYQAWLADAERSAQDLEALLRKGPIDSKAVELVFQRSRQLCSSCHAKYRDVPGQR